MSGVTDSPWPASRSAAAIAAAGVAVDDRVRERPDDLLGGVGDHRLEVLAGRPPAPARPRGRAGRARWRGAWSPSPRRSTRRRRRPARARTRAVWPPRSQRGSSRACGASKEWTSPARRLDRLGELLRRLHLRRLLARDQDDRRRPAAGPRGPRPPARPASPSSARRRPRAGSGARAISESAGSAAAKRPASGPALDPAPRERLQRAGPALVLGARAKAATVASIFASSVPAIRYAGPICGLSRRPARLARG